MATLRLNQHRVDALKPRKAAYDVRDRDLKGFGVRVLPSGAKRYFIHSQHDGQRVWKIVGDAGSIATDEARSRARTLVAAIRKGDDDSAAAPPDTPFETVAEEVFRRYARNWKPSTLKVNRGYYKNHILPWFAGRPISEIAPHDIQLWFASLHDTRHAGLGVRVRPSGHRSYVYHRKGEEGARRITLGSALLMGVEEAFPRGSRATSKTTTPRSNAAANSRNASRDRNSRSRNSRSRTSKRRSRSGNRSAGNP